MCCGTSQHETQSSKLEKSDSEGEAPGEYITTGEGIAVDAAEESPGTKGLATRVSYIAQCQSKGHINERGTQP